MKICYLVDNIDPSHGEGRYASDLIFAVKKSGHEVVILKERDEGLEGNSILKSGLGIFIAALKTRKYFKNCDVVHALDGYPYGIIAALANLGLKKRLIITMQGTHTIALLYSFPVNVLVKWAYKKADKVISISRYTKEEFLKKSGIKNIEVINHGINFEKFYRIHLDSPENFILGVGALKYRKGYHISIPAFAEAKKELSDLKYKIIGSQKDTAYFDELKNLATRYGVDKDIEFLTSLSDEKLSDFYRRAKLFILTSVNENHHFEGFGLVFLEAAAAGLPNVGTLDNGIEDAIKNGYNGILVPQNDIRTTTAAIVKILKDEKLYNELSRNSLTWAEDHDWDNVVRKYLDIYQDVLVNTGARG